MKIYMVTNLDKLDRNLESYVKNRIYSELDQLQSQIHLVHVSLITGTKENSDESVSCQIAAWSPGKPLIMVKQTSSDSLNAFEYTLIKFLHAVSQKLQVSVFSTKPKSSWIPLNWSPSYRTK